MVAQLEYIQQHVLEDLLEEKRILYEENCQLRTMLDPEQHAERMAELAQENTRLRDDVASCQRQISTYKLRDERRAEFLRNKDLIPMEKLVALETLERVEKKRDDIHVPIDIKVRDIAASIGTTPETAGKRLRALDRMGLLSYDARTEWDQGEFITIASVAFTDLVKTPSSIKKSADEKQGGPREKKCKNPRCDSTNFDSYTALYCRECSHVSIYGQVGLSHDANVKDLIAAFSDENTVHVDPSAKCALPEESKAQPFPIYQDAFEEIDSFVPEIGEDESILSWENTISVSRQDTEVLPPEETVIESTLVEPEENPVTPPLPAREIVTTWLSERLTSDSPAIYATGSLNSADKYKTLAWHDAPNLDKYLAGDVRHIYGSKLRRAADSKTSVLCYDLDNATLDEQVYEFMAPLAAAGASPVYWMRYANGRKRGHLEIYFDQAVDADLAHAWMIEQCPQLGIIEECFPVGGRQNSQLSWPLYQRVGNTVTPCSAIALLSTGECVDLNDAHDLDALADLILKSRTPAALLDGFLPPSPVPTTQGDRGGLLESSFPTKSLPSLEDLRDQVIAEQNASLSWETITDLCGGLTRGKFCAVWRKERTPSVHLYLNQDRACDYGSKGSTPKMLDKYGAWCLIKGIDQKSDVNERCQQLRQHSKSALAVPSSSAREVQA